MWKSQDLWSTCWARCDDTTFCINSGGLEYIIKSFVSSTCLSEACSGDLFGIYALRLDTVLYFTLLYFTSFHFTLLFKL